MPLAPEQKSQRPLRTGKTFETILDDISRREDRSRLGRLEFFLRSVLRTRDVIIHKGEFPEREAKKYYRSLECVLETQAQLEDIDPELKAAFCKIRRRLKGWIGSEVETLDKRVDYAIDLLIEAVVRRTEELLPEEWEDNAWNRHVDEKDAFTPLHAFL